MSKTKEQIVADIEAGRTSLGIEYGSTRVKAVLDDADNEPIAIGTFDWENSLIDGYWTYSEDEIFEGLKTCYASLKADVEAKYGVTLRKVGALGISAMMHGYLPFDADGQLLVPHLAQHHHDRGRPRDFAPLCVPHARALEREPHLPGRP